MSVQTNITAHAGGGNADATAIVSKFNIVSTCATHLDSVILPDNIGDVTVRNAGAKDCAVFPPAGAAIDALGADAAYPLASGSVQEFVKTSATQWYTVNRSDRFVSASVTFNQDALTWDSNTYPLDVSATIPPSGRGRRLEVAVWGSNATATSLTVANVGGGPSVTKTLDSASSLARGWIYCNATGYVQYTPGATKPTSGNFTIYGYFAET